MFYTDKVPTTSSFNVHPKGIIPLGETTVEMLNGYDVKPPTAGSKMAAHGICFRVTRKDWGTGALMLCADSEQSTLFPCFLVSFSFCMCLCVCGEGAGAGEGWQRWRLKWWYGGCMAGGRVAKYGNGNCGGTAGDRQHSGRR